ncbi:circularly permuted type 2 ATP-grasp protein [Bdellovibrionota bacterium FG-1]
MLFDEQPELLRGHLPTQYLPHMGYIGSQELKVPNYLFTSRVSAGFKGHAVGYPHCRELVDLVLSRPAEEQHRRNQALTDFLRKREMTFSKLTKSGEYRIFAVPCTTTPLPVPKSLFDTLERSAQVLVAALRLVLQDIYGSQSVRKSAFVQALPDEVRRLFINAVEKSPQYFPQLHDPVMRNYPFFDVVGLDLVLTEDLGDAVARGPRPISQALPFRILEINAGSPSGASNNLHILEGLKKFDPEALGTMGKVMPNDHFQILGATYRSLGETWTGVRDGVQIVLPPGGESGAAPEIHQLAMYSGLIYTDSGQLYQDSAGFIRLRTVSGSDPVVTAIYSRINSDSALFDPDRKLFLRDAETGKSLYVTDPLATTKHPKPLRNAKGQPIPLESSYMIPGAIEAILDRKIYVGGLNRVLDNKIILSALCHYAPLFFKKELKTLGIDVDEVLPVSPPETLPSQADSVEVIAKNPEDWVIKAPNLSGGKGVYILKTLPLGERREILAKAKAHPKDFAYQKLVRIGRIPIAKKDSCRDYHFANIAADIRMWSFYGAGAEMPLPRLTHNGLIRTAPVEKGPLSSIVNTSKGGGYAPMIVVDDVGHPASVTVEELTQKKIPAVSPTDLPAFAGAQIVQIAKIVGELRDHLKVGTVELVDAYFLVTSLRKQCREILSFLHPNNMESVNEMIESLERHLRKTRVRVFFERRARLRIQAVTALKRLEGALSDEFFNRLDELSVLNVTDNEIYALTPEQRQRDREIISDLKRLCCHVRVWPADQARVFAALGSLVEQLFPAKVLSPAACQSLLFKLETFCLLAQSHLSIWRGGKAFSELFNKSEKVREMKFDILFAEPFRPLAKNEHILDYKPLIATEEEVRTGKLLTETGFVAEDLRKARFDWLATLAETPEDLEAARWAHFVKHPIIAEYQRLVDRPLQSSASAIMQMLEILPYAKFNLLQYARTQGISPRELFTNKLVDRRIAVLSTEQRAEVGLSTSGFAGECFATKRKAHGLFSDSNIYTWTALELNPLIQAYTVGHELVHFQQIRAMMKQEVEALQGSPLEFARFLNFYGNFLGMSSGTIESAAADVLLDRKVLYGFAELMGYARRGNNWVTEMRQALRAGTGTWNHEVSKLGSIVSYSTDASVQVKVKAIREVIPALENAKNIVFAQELGLKLDLDPVQSALPSANSFQCVRFSGQIQSQVRSAKLDWETLRIIANHQYPGVRFPRHKIAVENLTLHAPLVAIALGGSYNQTQQ